jgi:ubiquinone/menaquinone biosynthesis C-methylase UbiE
MKSKSQRELWDMQHALRRGEHKDIANTPNEFAIKCIGFIPEGGKVLDLGAASGRDSRYFVREKNCEVFALDFSFTALQHLEEDAKEDGSEDFLRPVNADIKSLPFNSKEVLDAVYARSSLHLSDNDLDKLLNQCIGMLKEGGYLMIEGKNLLDPKISQSRSIADNLVIDSSGHLRRVWTKGYILEHIIRKFGLTLVELNLSSGQRVDRDSKYVNFIAQKYESK